VLIDTNILIRTLQPHHALFPLADGAIQRLPQQGRDLVIFPQSLIELWAVPTRSIEPNGLGLTTSAAAAELERIKSMFLLLPDTPDAPARWRWSRRWCSRSGRPAPVE
jgi:hypothetical protein